MYKKHLLVSMVMHIYANMVITEKNINTCVILESLSRLIFCTRIGQLMKTKGLITLSITFKKQFLKKARESAPLLARNVCPFRSSLFFRIGFVFSVFYK